VIPADFDTDSFIRQNNAETHFESAVFSVSKTGSARELYIAVSGHIVRSVNMAGNYSARLVSELKSKSGDLLASKETDPVPFLENRPLKLGAIFSAKYLDIKAKDLKDATCDLCIKLSTTIDEQTIDMISVASAD
jgi:hypothetical protein